MITVSISHWRRSYERPQFMMTELPSVSDTRMNELLTDAVDFHVHTAPDSIPRYATDIETAHDALDAGMRTVVVKSHIVPTAGRVELTNRHLEKEILAGGVTLNGGVGGLNPATVEVALDLGARVVWLPTAWAANHAQQARDAGETQFMGQRVPTEAEEISLLSNGELDPVVDKIIALLAGTDVVLGTGHISIEESLVVAEACAEANVPCVINHAFFRVVDATLDNLERLVDYGATIEFCAYSLQSTADHSVARVADTMKRLGPENCLLATDFGQAENAPVPGLAEFAQAVIDEGVDEEVVRETITTTPATLLSLDA